MDDEPVNLRILGSLLQQKGLDVGFASNAAQALESLKYRVPDLFLLDIMMPQVDRYKTKEEFATIMDTYKEVTE